MHALIAHMISLNRLQYDSLFFRVIWLCSTHAMADQQQTVPIECDSD